MDKSSLKSVLQGPSSAGSDGSLPSTPPPGAPKPLISAKGVENAKKRLRAFSIQKKNPKSVPLPPLPKNTGSAISGNTVLIGKLSSVKLSVKAEIDETKKPPKPPKPGATRRQLGRVQEYCELQKQTLSEIEEMKRKMELVELGIPLGLICPTATSEKAMPTKAMPPIKSFLTPEQLDEIIRDAKKAKAEGKKFKFDYERLLPDYDNPFQRKKFEEADKDKKSEKEISEKRRSEKYDPRIRHFRGRKRFFEKEDRNRDERGRSEKREDDKKRDIKRHSSDRRKSSSDRKSVDTCATDNVAEKEVKEGEINLKDFLVCDSWSLDNDDKTNSSSPAVEKTIPKAVHETKDLIEQQINVTTPVKTSESPVRKVGKLQPVVDSFKFELDSNDDEILDIFDEDCEINRYSKPTKKPRSDDQDSFKDFSLDGMDDTFLESVINEIKQENLSEDESQDKSLVGYDESPIKEEIGTPELDDSVRSCDYSDGYRSTESGYKSTDSLRSRNSEYLVSECSPDGLRLSVERELDAALEQRVSKPTVESLETWSFVLKICQPLLFRHDKNKCYKETRVIPKLWYTENPKLCDCVKDRSVVYEELEMCKMSLVDKLYGCDQISEAPPDGHAWYSRCPLVETSSVQASEWEVEECPPEAGGVGEAGGMLDQEYQRFMEAVWPEVAEATETSRSTTPVQQERKRDDSKERKEERKSKKMKLSSEGWSQESDVEVEVASKKRKIVKEKKKSRKRKHSPSSDSASSDIEVDAKKKKIAKKKYDKKLKAKSVKRRRKEKLKKLKEKQKKKKKMKIDKVEELSDDEGDEIEEKKKEQKQLKKKKLKKLKKKAQKKKKVQAKSSSSSSESSDTEPERKKKKRKEDKRKKDKKKRKHSPSESQSDDLFDENILNNIKTEKFDDNEKNLLTDFSPRRQYSKRQDIINVKELQNDFVGNSIYIKKEMEEDKVSVKSVAERSEEIVQEKSEKELFKEPPIPPPEESNLSQCSSQESVSSKDHVYEKDESHLRPSSQNSNYSFNDVITASQAYKAPEATKKAPAAIEVQETTHKAPETVEVTFKAPEVSHKPPEVTYKTSEVTYKAPDVTYKPDDVIGYQKDEDYGHGDYEMYEQLAMAYQSDVANQQVSPPTSGEHNIETVALPRGGRARGEIKCDWRAGDTHPHTQPCRPSRWGLKPGDVNIVLTGGGEFVPSPVYKIQSLANRNVQDASIGYDEAYADMYAASDKLQYGDCFSQDAAETATVATSRTSSLDDRINLALQASVLGEVANEEEADINNEKRKLPRPESEPVKVPKRVSFADGYKPGQDSDTEEPPRKKKKSRRGCAWPCPATHPDHVPLWDALPPPPPPPGSPPPPPGSPPPPRAPPAPPASLLRASRPARRGQDFIPPGLHMMPKFDPNSIPGFMPPEPPPHGLMAFPPSLG